MEKNQKGFSAIAITMFVIAASVLAAAGVYFYQTQSAKPKAAPVVQKTETPADEPTTNADEVGLEVAESEKLSETEPVEIASGQTEPIDTTAWKVYRNEEYGFEFKYPDFYVRDDKISSWHDKSIISLAKFNHRSAEEMTNGLFVGIFNGGIADYRLIDPPGGFTWCLDATTGVWVDCRSKTAAGDYGPERIAGDIEAYLYQSGDITCSWDYLIILHKAKDKMIEIINLTCGKSYDVSNEIIDYKTPDFVLSPQIIMETFKFTDGEN